MVTVPVEEYLRPAMMPTIWCPGCGHGIIMNAVLRAIARLEIPKDDICVVSGIGCASRAPGYLDFNTLHTTHGRALAFATGIKVANPKLRVIVLTGDGDAAAIGGNHLIHAARRNLGITTVCFNNSIYGMTSGQYSPMTPSGRLGTTAPYGNVERNFDLCDLVRACGANYVARATTAHPRQLSTYVEHALTTPGFAFVEAVTQCPTYFGRKNRLGGPVELIEWFKKNSITVAAAAKLDPADLAGKIIIGEFHRGDAPDYSELYAKVIQRAKEAAGK
ncbi:MAG: 2-oxoacid:ferredoxin oxidoreductase subunit beta [Firmicutes bacterium]|jgi:2-oxoglutarate ferredoxin oxidoreductase subunit beta|nr:2-oxoacid:ferredoxin oxidoreductase subunit beta [Bacillota bacterium]